MEISQMLSAVKGLLYSASLKILILTASLFGQTKAVTGSRSYIIEGQIVDGSERCGLISLYDEGGW
jgi:hypothetical protein